MIKIFKYSILLIITLFSNISVLYGNILFDTTFIGKDFVEREYKKDNYDNTLALKQIEFLKQKFSYDNNINGVKEYFEKLLIEYYSDDTLHPSIKEKIIRFISWLDSNSYLLDDFLNELISRRAECNCKVDNDFEIRMFSFFSGWLGIKYAEHQYLKIYPSWKPNPIIYLEKEFDIAKGYVNGNDTIFCYYYSFIDYSNLFIASFSTGMHERAHTLGYKFLLNEMIPAYFQENFTFPLKTSSTEYRTEGNIFFIGERNFYNMYQIYSGIENSAKKEDLEYYFYNEYTEFAFYPWFEKFITPKNICDFKFIPEYPLKNFGDIYNSLVNKTIVKNDSIKTVLFKRLNIANLKIEEKFNTFFTYIFIKYFGVFNKYSFKEFFYDFVNYMNRYFGIPETVTCFENGLYH